MLLSTISFPELQLQFITTESWRFLHFLVFLTVSGTIERSLTAFDWEQEHPWFIFESAPGDTTDLTTWGSGFAHCGVGPQQQFPGLAKSDPHSYTGIWNTSATFPELVALRAFGLAGLHIYFQFWLQLILNGTGFQRGRRAWYTVNQPAAECLTCCALPLSETTTICNLAFTSWILFRSLATPSTIPWPGKDWT